MMATLSVENLTCGYNSHTVLADVNLTARPGEVLALIGPNGVTCGWTDTIYGNYPPSR
jgi:ABC-type Mn2+/Zn2+ transport system ATPase subunit